MFKSVIVKQSGAYQAKESCLACLKAGHCVVDDDAVEIAARMHDADVLVQVSDANKAVEPPGLLGAVSAIAKVSRPSLFSF